MRIVRDEELDSSIDNGSEWDTSLQDIYIKYHSTTDEGMREVYRRTVKLFLVKIYQQFVNPTKND